MFRQLAGIALGIFALGALSGCLGTAQSQTSPSKCTSSKLKAAGKKASQKTSCWSKAAGKGQAIDGACLQKASESFTSAFDKAETAGDCTTTGNTDEIEALVDALITDLVAALRGTDNTTASKCTSSEFKAAGKKASKLAGCHAKAASKGDPLDPACVTKVKDSFTKSFDKAVAAGDCLTTATGAATETRIDDFIDDLVLALNRPPTTTLCPFPTSPLGARDLTLGSNSHLLSNALSSGGGNVDSGPWVGTISLLAGIPDPVTGVASLVIGSDSKFGLATVDGAKRCGFIAAAGSTGKIDCDGGTPMDVINSIDSNGTLDGEPQQLAVEQGAPGRTGSGYVKFKWTVISCPDSKRCNAGDRAGGSCTTDDTNATTGCPGASCPSCCVAGACSTLASSADCLDPAKVDFSKVPLAAEDFAFTTETATGTLTEARQGGSSTLTRTGVPFDCCNWTSTGSGTVETPAPNEDTNVLGVIKDTVNIFQFAE